MKLSDIVEKLGGTLEGDGDIEIAAVAGLGEAGEGDLSFLANPKYSAQVSTTKAAAVEMLNVVTAPPPVPAVSTKTSGSADAKLSRSGNRASQGS